MNHRTIRDITVKGDVWAIIDDWAEQHAFRLRKQVGPSRSYQRGSGVRTPAMMLEATLVGNRLHLEAWVKAGPLRQLGSAFLVSRETGLESGGKRGAAHRAIARKAANTLLASLGEKPIG